MAMEADKMAAESSNSKTSKRTVKIINGRKVVFDEDGKPSCNSLLDFQMATRGGGTDSSTKAMAGAMAMAGSGISTAKKESNTRIPPGYKACPPDVEVLGRSTWTFLHTMAGQYPIKANEQEQTEMKSFLNVFSKIYPCWWCAEDLQNWMSTKGNEPKVGGRDELGNWLCDAHNEVNKKLSKPTFDCRQWKARWRDGWADGSCD